MATNGTINSLLERLIALLTKADQDTRQFMVLKGRVNDTLKSSYSRTDQFAVAKQLEGLQEKFQVLNKDELADALRVRLNELNEHRSSSFPEVLSLLLQLSDRPAQLSSVDRIQKLAPEETVRPLTWSEIDASGSAFCDEFIWDDADFAAGSSDDDIVSVSSDLQPARTFQKPSTNLEEDYVFPDEIFSSGEDEGLIASIESAQYWRDKNSSKNEKPGSRTITELQIVREIIFMLQGLTTSLFCRLDGNVEIDRRYTLSHLSYESLSSLLQSFRICGTKIDVLRQFAKGPQSVSCLQTFHRSIEDCLAKFDAFLSATQSQHLSPTSTVPVSLLRLSEDVHRESKLLLLLSQLVSELKQQETDTATRCLDLLYDMVCMAQAMGDHNEFKSLSSIFFSCFETYSRPIHHWMHTGQLGDSAESFFIVQSPETNDLRTLWHDWYALKSSVPLNAPIFMQPFADRVFVAGKNMVFLRQLHVPADLGPLKESSLNFENVFPPDSSPSLCLPFSALLEFAFSRIVDENLALTSSLLRKALNEELGLSMSLEALEYIYLCKDMSLLAPIDAKIFELIDRGGAWSDRFLLTDLARTTFSANNLIVPDRLVVRSSQDGPQSHIRSVKTLARLSFDYILPWHFANIITKSGILGYQRISTFLMQIRRAKYVILKQRLQYPHKLDDLDDSRDNTLSYSIRHNMLWFLNILYSHFTDFVISTAAKSLRAALDSSKNVDDMITAHRTYISSLEDQCLLSQKLVPFYKTIVALLDLCVGFTELQTSHYKAHRVDSTKTPKKNIKPIGTGMTPRKTRYEYSYGDEDPTDDEDDKLSDDELPRSRPRDSSSHETHELLKKTKVDFNRLVTFMSAGLKTVGRAHNQISWEMLGEKLEWRNEIQFVRA